MSNERLLLRELPPEGELPKLHTDRVLFNISAVFSAIELAARVETCLYDESFTPGIGDLNLRENMILWHKGQGPTDIKESRVYRLIYGHMKEIELAIDIQAMAVHTWATPARRFRQVTNPELVKKRTEKTTSEIEYVYEYRLALYENGIIDEAYVRSFATIAEDYDLPIEELRLLINLLRSLVEEENEADPVFGMTLTRSPNVSNSTNTNQSKDLSKLAVAAVAEAVKSTALNDEDNEDDAQEEEVIEETQDSHELDVPTSTLTSWPPTTMNPDLPYWKNMMKDRYLPANLSVKPGDIEVYKTALDELYRIKDKLQDSQGFAKKMYEIASVERKKYEEWVRRVVDRENKMEANGEEVIRHRKAGNTSGGTNIIEFEVDGEILQVEEEEGPVETNGERMTLGAYDFDLLAYQRKIDGEDEKQDLLREQCQYYEKNGWSQDMYMSLRLAEEEDDEVTLALIEEATRLNWAIIDIKEQKEAEALQARELRSETLPGSAFPNRY